MSIEEKFIETYTPLLTQFMEKVENVITDDLPEPHLPVYGKGYENSPYKIAFVGWETRDNAKLKDFISDYKEVGVQKALHRWDKYFGNDFLFTTDGSNCFHNNTGTDFWGFIFKFLSCFYDIDDWVKIKNKEFPEILKSFVWSNIASIERFEATDRKENTSRAEWEKVKTASLIFDSAKYLVDVFQPNIIIILRWEENDKWLTESFDYSDDKKIADHLDYYFIKSNNTHVFWTAHPGWLSRNKRMKQIITDIIKSIQNKKVFTSFPGENFLVRTQTRKKLLETLKKQLVEMAFKIGLATLDEEWGTGGESYFYFSLPFSNRKVSICLGFDNGYNNFSIGVDIKDKSSGYKNLKSTISSKLKTPIGKDENYPNWAFLHYFKGDLENWDTNQKVWDDINIGETASFLIEKIKIIQTSLVGIEL